MYVQEGTVQQGQQDNYICQCCRGTGKHKAYMVKCEICYNTDTPIMAENTTCGHHLCKDCAIMLEQGVLEDGKKVEVVAPTQDVCLINAGMCPFC